MIRAPRDCILIALCICGLSWQRPEGVRADVLVLKNGANLRGERIEGEGIDRNSYVIQTESGARVRFDRAQVAEYRREPKEALEYEKLAPKFADTVKDQWAIAEWCRERGLTSQRRQHLRRIVELDPQHSAAWVGLGYTEIEGKWVTKQGFFEEQGYVYYRGRWRLPQEIDVLEEKRRIELLEREWFARLRNWRGQLTSDRESEAAKNIAAIRDPLAIKALSDNLRREKVPAVRLLYIQALAAIPDGRAVEVILTTMLNDPDEEIFHVCIDKLVAMQRPSLTKVLVNSLKDRSNMRVNRAAYALGRLGDNNAIPSLIAALVTTHEITTTKRPSMAGMFASSANGSPATQSASQSMQSPSSLGSGTGFSMTPTSNTIRYEVANQEVLQALVRLSGGQSFGFDRRAWTNWWALTTRASASGQSLR